MIQKRYFSIGEVSELLQVNPSLIRFWEKNFEVLRPRKNRKGDRLFTPEDIENLKLIYQLVKVQGFTLKGANKALKEDASWLRKKARAVEGLTQVRGFLEELKAGL